MTGRPYVWGQDYLQHMIDREQEADEERAWREEAIAAHCRRERLKAAVLGVSHVDEFGAENAFGEGIE